jgi:hypothetical protein
LLIDCNDKSKHKISYDTHRSSRNHRDNSNSFCNSWGEEIDEEQQAAIEIADQAVHEAFPPEEGEEVSEEDVRFHQGLCAVGITTEALEGLGGCEVLPPLVESDDD